MMLFLQDMEKIFIPKNVLPQTDDQQEIGLHGLIHASLHSYGACVYLKAVLKLGVFSVYLEASKSGLAPIKSTTIQWNPLIADTSLRRIKNFVLDKFLITKPLQRGHSKADTP